MSIFTPAIVASSRSTAWVGAGLFIVAAAMGGAAHAAGGGIDLVDHPAPSPTPIQRSRPLLPTAGPAPGTRVSMVPAGSVTRTIGGRTYYEQNNVWYQRSGIDYVVVAPPVVWPNVDNSPVLIPPVPSDEPMIRALQGQSASQLAHDRAECHHEAAEQAGYDTWGMQPDIAADELAQRRAAFHAAMAACMQARGYAFR